MHNSFELKNTNLSFFLFEPFVGLPTKIVSHRKHVIGFLCIIIERWHERLQWLWRHYFSINRIRNFVYDSSALVLSRTASWHGQSIPLCSAGWNTDQTRPDQTRPEQTTIL